PNSPSVRYSKSGFTAANHQDQMEETNNDGQEAQEQEQKDANERSKKQSRRGAIIRQNLRKKGLMK
ncbi:hypothetical protein, partial [Ferrimonas kyonanensis]|uniref:hypothetical protein n=1 Tax=Ferrimonas kyonanensis TaxID=364763 RepID=UPI00146CDFC2